MTKKKDPKDFLKKGPMYSPKQVEELVQELLECVQEPEVFHVTYFECVKKNKKPGWLNGLGARYPKIKATLKQAQLILGNKLISHSILRGGNNQMIHRLVPMYMPDFEKNRKQERKQELKDKIEFEKFKSSVNATKEDDMIASIEKFNISQEERAKILKYEKFLVEKNLVEEWERQQLTDKEDEN